MMEREDSIVAKLSAVIRKTRLLQRNIRDSLCYFLRGRSSLPQSIRRIVFVCKGNICRSAFAEYLMKARAKAATLDIESCGLDTQLETPAPREAINTAKKFGLHMEGHLSRGWECCELERADLIIAMEFWQYRKLLKHFPHKRGNIRLLREFANFPENLLCNINDPFGGSEETFERCFRQIERALRNVNAKV